MKLDIKKVLESKKISVAQLSRNSDISKVQLFKIIDSDGVKPISPKVDTLLKIATALGVTLFDLFDHNPKDQTSIYVKNNHGELIEIGSIKNNCV